MPHTSQHKPRRQFGFTLIELLVVLLILGLLAGLVVGQIEVAGAGVGE